MKLNDIMQDVFLGKTKMKDGKIVVARLWHKYDGGVKSRTPVILGLNPEKYRTICIYLIKESKIPNFFEEKGLKAFYISGKSIFNVFNIQTVWKLSGVLKREKVDILHCHRHKATVYGTIAAKLAGVPVIFAHVHGLNRSKKTRRKFVNRFILKRVNKILTVGEAVKKDVLRNNPSVRPEKVVSIGNSIDYDRFADVRISKEQAKKSIGLSPNSFVFGTVGRLAPTKGQAYLIEAFVKVKMEIPAAELIFIGTGRLESQLKEQALKAGLADSIHFLGTRDDVPLLLRAMDVFILPSIAEGMPRSLLEAMAVGVVCVATAVGGIVEILADGELGFLVPAENSDALAEAMIKLATMSEAERNNIVEKAKQRITDKYSHVVIRKKIEDIYHKQVRAKWNFSEYLKYGIDLIEVEIKTLPVEKLGVQYNPDRFGEYKSLHKGLSDTVLDMNASPHCRLLEAYKKNASQTRSNIRKFDYYKMQRLYGKNHKAAVSKVNRFIELYENIKKVGFNSNIIVVNRPTIKNKYNSGYEIYTGHHRVACCIVLGMKSVPSKIVEIRTKWE